MSRADETSEAGDMASDVADGQGGHDASGMPVRGWHRLPCGRRGLLVSIAVVVILNLPGLWLASDTPLHRDNDTPQILAAIRADTSATGLLRWFVTDWPLGNCFYRPLVAVSLAADSALFGEWARGYRLVNWALATLTALGVLVWLRALSWDPRAALLGAGIFSAQQAIVTPSIPTLPVVAALVLGAALTTCDAIRAPAGARMRASLASVGLLIAAVVYLLRMEWVPLTTVVAWIAARTALLGALPSVWALAALAGWARSGRRWLLAATVLLTAAALCAYEQSVMLPVAAAVMITMLPRHANRRALVAVALMLALVPAYATLREQAVRGEVSAHMLSQLKSNLVAGSARDAAFYVFPPCLAGWQAWTRGDGWLALMDAQFFALLLLALTGGALYWRGITVAPRGVAALMVLRAVLFAPMALLHPFRHYFYLPELAGAALMAALLCPEWVRTGGTTAAPGDVSEPVRDAGSAERSHSG